MKNIINCPTIYFIDKQLGIDPPESTKIRAFLIDNVLLHDMGYIKPNLLEVHYIERAESDSGFMINNIIYNLENIRYRDEELKYLQIYSNILR